MHKISEFLNEYLDHLYILHNYEQNEFPLSSLIAMYSVDLDFSIHVWTIILVVKEKKVLFVRYCASSEPCFWSGHFIKYLQTDCWFIKKNNAKVF